jgi:threonine dehydrogenase-like Zn-dependent dehydrogenase
LLAACFANPLPAALHVGAAAAEFEADDTMIIAGGITPARAAGQEGKLRAVAVVLEQKPFGKLAIVACDVLMITRAHLDPVAAEIERTTGIPAAHVLINCTHTHHAPSTVVLHGYSPDETFLPNLEAHKLGGYQVWTGYHSYAEPGTGERIADEAVTMLKELTK